MNLADDALRWLSKCAVPGNYWIDFIPFSEHNNTLQYREQKYVINLVRHVPDWIFKMKWREEGKVGYELAQRMVSMPYDMTKKRIVSLFL